MSTLPFLVDGIPAREIIARAKRLGLVSPSQPLPAGLQAPERANCTDLLITRQRFDPRLADRILHTVARLCYVDPAHIVEHRRDSLSVEARHIVLALTPGPHSAVGRHFNRDHGAVFCSRKKVRQWIEDFPAFAAKIEMIRREIGL